METWGLARPGLATPRYCPSHLHSQANITGFCAVLWIQIRYIEFWSGSRILATFGSGSDSKIMSIFEKSVKNSFGGKKFLSTNFKKKEIKRIMAPEDVSLSGEFLSSILHLLPLILIYPFLPVWIRIPKVAEYRFNLDPDPNSST